MKEEELVKARQLHISAPALLPMLEDSQKLAYDKLLRHFRDTGEVKVAMVAECNAYSTILEDIQYKLQELENLSKGAQ